MWHFLRASQLTQRFPLHCWSCPPTALRGKQGGHSSLHFADSERTGGSMPDSVLAPVHTDRPHCHPFVWIYPLRNSSLFTSVGHQCRRKCWSLPSLRDRPSRWGSGFGSKVHVFDFWVLLLTCCVPMKKSFNTSEEPYKIPSSSVIICGDKKKIGEKEMSERKWEIIPRTSHTSYQFEDLPTCLTTKGGTFYSLRPGVDSKVTQLRNSNS